MIRSRDQDKIIDQEIRSRDKIKRSRDLRIYYKIRSSKVQMFKVKVKVKRVL